MYDPKFEKEVQQKMEALEFSPSDAVWTNIEQAVNANKKRRRLPFFWMFFLSGALLLGAGIIYKTSRPSGIGATAPVKPATAASRTPTKPASTVAITPASSGTTVLSSTAGADMRNKENTAIVDAVAKNIAAGNTVTNKITTSGGGTRLATETVKRNGMAATAAGARTPNAGARTTPAGARTIPAGATTTTAGTRMIATGAMISASNGSGEGSGDKIGSIKANSDGSPGKDGSAASGMRHNDHIQGLASFRLPAPKISGARFPVQKSSGLISLSTPKRPWEAAFTGGIGISSFRQVAMHQSNVSSNIASPVFSYLVVPSLYAYNSPYTSKGGPSSIEAGPAFYAGVLARKPLSARWAVTIGLDLSYNSSRVHTGPIVNVFAPTTLSLINTAAAAPIQTYPYYVTGNDQVFTNRYYSLEIPATVQWQLNHSRSFPLFLESGLSFSYLVSSDALYYNSNSGVYFKDRDVVNRAQVNFTSSLMVGLPLGGVNLQAGPQLEYGLTSLLRPSATAGQHLFYGGLRVVIIPKGKK